MPERVSLAELLHVVHGAAGLDDDGAGVHREVLVDGVLGSTRCRRAA